MKHKKVYLIVGVIILCALAILGTLSFRAKSHNVVDAQSLDKDTVLHPHQGNTKSNVKVVLFGDYKCPYCGDFEKNILPKIKKDYIDTNQIELRYVNVLLHGKESDLGARASLAINQYAPEVYWDFNQALYHAQPKEKEAVSKGKWLTESLVQKEIQALSITSKQKQQILEAYNQKKFYQQAKHDHQLAKQYQVPEVPSLYVNGERVKDVTDYQVVKDKIDEALKEHPMK
ncbi:DsbA family protein [Staphylococcus americanisciuri]|nr:DsbA family protein [Staphylococcus americanisciuri]